MIETVTKHYVDGKFENYIMIKDGAKFFVPLAEGNTDYQEILKWVTEGNTIEPADE